MRIPCDNPAYEISLKEAVLCLRQAGIWARLGDRNLIIVPRPEGDERYHVEFKRAPREERLVASIEGRRAAGNIQDQEIRAAIRDLGR